LRENGVAKILPDQDLLIEAYIGMERGRRLKEEIEKHKIDMGDFKAPENLAQRVRKYLKRHPEERWDAAVRAIVVDEAAE
jgi:hypothetical protein